MVVQKFLTTCNPREGNKEQLLVDRVNAIQKENRILLKKMLTIDLKPGKYNPQRIKMYTTPSSYSLNRNKRIRELTRVTHENKMLLQRLQSAQSIYDHTKIPVQKFPKPCFRATNEPRIMSAVGGRTFGYQTMPIKQRRAKSSYAVARRTKKKKKRVMTAGYGGRKRSAVRKADQAARPITAKGPNIGRRNKSSNPNNQEEEDNGFRPETVPFTNIGPLGATEPQDGDDKIKQEITREVTGEREEVEVSKESEHEEKPVEDKYHEKEKQLDNLSDEASNNHDNEKSSNKEIIKETEENQESNKSVSSKAKAPEEPAPKHESGPPSPKNQEPSHDSQQKLAPLPESPKADPAPEPSPADHHNKEAEQQS
ncbi:unnamed protein product [Moneuplotes crassus]|uniref:Cilia- and flagella-associated protein 97 n=1 Tax=Euplotes crassus TaxID=5936 RepID=A0AAD1USR2_EUPCR|nr:unnamed protein product [Moneuplotes crassus]